MIEVSPGGVASGVVSIFFIGLSRAFGDVYVKPSSGVPLIDDLLSVPGGMGCALREVATRKIVSRVCEALTAGCGHSWPTSEDAVGTLAGYLIRKARFVRTCTVRPWCEVKYPGEGKDTMDRSHRHGCE